MDRHPYWNKIKFIADHLLDYDWVVWMDDDAGFISNDSIESIFNTDKQLLYANDMNGFNSGVMAIKRSKQMFSSFMFIWERMYDSFKYNKFPEQDAIKSLIIDVLHQGKSIDGTKYNAYHKSLTVCDQNQANEQTIILHIAGGSEFKEMHKAEITALYSIYA